MTREEGARYTPAEASAPLRLTRERGGAGDGWKTLGGAHPWVVMVLPDILPVQLVEPHYAGPGSGRSRHVAAVALVGQSRGIVRS